MCTRILKCNEGHWNNANFWSRWREQLILLTSSTPLIGTVRCDQSSGHCAFKEDVLNMNRMNVNEGGAQPRMWDTVWDGKVQRLVLSDGRPREWEQFFKNEGLTLIIWRQRICLGSHTDFKYEKTALEHLMQEKGKRAIFLPKFRLRAQCDWVSVGWSQEIYTSKVWL